MKTCRSSWRRNCAGWGTTQTQWRTRDSAANRMRPSWKPHRLPIEFSSRSIRESLTRVANGTLRWFESSGRTFQTSDGQDRTVIISRDITAQRENLARLTASEQRFAS